MFYNTEVPIPLVISGLERRDLGYCCRESGKNKDCAKHRKDLNSRKTQYASKQYKGINNDLKHLQIRGKVKMVEDKNNLQAIKKGSDQNATMRG